MTASTKPTTLALRAGLAHLIAAHMADAGYTADTAAAAEEHEWLLAATIALTPPPNAAMRTAVVALLHDRAQRSRCTRSRR